MCREDCETGVLDTSGWPMKAVVATTPRERRNIDRTIVISIH